MDRTRGTNGGNGGAPGDVPGQWDGPDEALDAGTVAVLRRHGASFLRHHFGGRPRMLEIQVTRRCNARCAWCDSWRAPGNGAEMDDYAALVRLIEPLGVALVGGDPLVRPDLERLVASIRMTTRVASLGVSTNGLAMDRDRALRLREAGADKLVVSVEGMEQAHDRARRVPGAFARLVGLLPDLAAAGFRAVQIQATVSERNAGDMAPLARLAIDCGVRIAYTLEGPARLGARDGVPDERSLGRLAEEIERVIEIAERSDAVVSSAGYLRRIVPFLRGDGAGFPPCGAGAVFLRATPDGWLRPCSALPSLGPWTAFPFPVRPVDCSACWSRRRGESGGRIGPARMVEILRAGRRE